MKRIIQKIAAPLMCGIFVLALFRFVLFIGYVPTDSMEPLIKTGSVILGCRIIGELKPGDVIIFRHEGAFLVKRVAGMPGDQITVRLAQDESENPLIIPDDCCFMLGDNGGHSIDSRHWEYPFISGNDIIAIVLGK